MLYLNKKRTCSNNVSIVKHENHSCAYNKRWGITQVISKSHSGAKITQMGIFELRGPFLRSQITLSAQLNELFDMLVL
jgi:hypothetical protein